MQTDQRKSDRNDAKSPQEPAASGRRRRPQNLGEWQDLISEKLEEAIQRGVFDDLPGAGKPLPLRENPNEPPDMRMANKLLKDNDLTPAWIGDRKALLADVEGLRQDMERQVAWHRTRAQEQAADPLALQRSWQRRVAGWSEQVDGLNRRIFNLNLVLPVPRLELLRLRLDEELDRLGASRSSAGG